MIIFVRHGETEANRAGRLQGRSDAPLTANGRRQAERVARLLAAEPPDRILASPLPRTVETAGAIASACGGTVVSDERLLELDYGEWEGRRVGDVAAREWTRWQADPSFAPPGGESLAAVRERVAAFCADFGTADGVTVAVSHVSPIKAAVAWALGAPDTVTWRTRLALGSLTRIECVPTPVLVSFNEVPAAP